MKRLRVILLYLLLGAVINVAVAWGGAYFPEFIYIDYESSKMNTYGVDWHVSRLDHLGMTEIRRVFHKPYPREPIQIRGRGNNIPWQRDDESVTLPWWYRIPDRSNAPDNWMDRETLRMVGYPFRSLYCEYNRGFTEFASQPWRDFDGASNEAGILTMHTGDETYSFPLDKFDYIDFGFVLPLSSDYKKCIFPYGPLFFGFMANTVLYAVILWLLISGPFVLRRFIRHRRGLCVKCAYDLRGAEHEACPECGQKCLSS